MSENQEDERNNKSPSENQENEKNNKSTSEMKNETNANAENKNKETKKGVTNADILGKQRVNINTSTSKAMYTFPKEQRFKELGKKPITEFYNLPSYISKKGTFIGYGKKTEFTTNFTKNGKSQEIYNVPREFDLSRRNGSPRYTFGLSRDTCKVPHDQTKNFPSPASYSPYKSFGSEGNKMSLYSRRIPANKNLYTPGPGAYSYMSLNPNGRYADSGFCNSPRSCWGLDNSQRSGMKFNGYPGPGAYNYITKINGNGTVFDSRKVSNPGKSMGLKLSFVGEKVITPGPGAYNSFSDFEGFSKK